MTKKLSLIDLIIDAGKLPKNKPSTVIDATTGQLRTLRFGDLLPATPNSLISKSEKNTKALAGFILTKALKKSLGKPIVFLLEGELGAGKTIFTKGLGKALKIKDEIVSPTFTLCYEYKIDYPCHSELDSESVKKMPKQVRHDNYLIKNDIKTRGISSFAPPIRRATADLSTEIDRLPTDSPIKNRICSDTEGLDLNNNFVEQDEILGWEVGGGSRCEGEKCDNKNISPLPISHPRPISHFSTSFLIHYDLYRIDSPQDLVEIKFLESIKPGNIYSIEWPERIDKETLEELKKKAYVVYIKIRHGKSACANASARQREIEWSNLEELKAPENLRVTSKRGKVIKKPPLSPK